MQELGTIQCVKKNQQTKDEITYTGEIPNMDKILKLWGGIWKDDNRTNKPVWIKESGNRISKTIKVQRFSVSDKDTRKVIKIEQHQVLIALETFDGKFYSILETTQPGLNR